MWILHERSDSFLGSAVDEVQMLQVVRVFAPYGSPRCGHPRSRVLYDTMTRRKRPV